MTRKSQIMNNMQLYHLLTTFCFLSTFALLHNVSAAPMVSRPQNVQQTDPAEQWAASLLQNMTQEEKAGQLIMAMAYSNLGGAHTQQVADLVSKHKIGGLIFMQGGPVRQAKLTNYYQSLARVPLFIAIDAEYGLAMRLDSSMRFPQHMTLGAINDDRYVHAAGAEIGRQCKRLGVHINFAPVSDVNVNPENPIIGMRSFGENKLKVASKAIAFMRGLQSQGIIANAKHFPGHGDTDKDSHYTLPVIKHDLQRLHSVELFPFKQMIADSLMSTMIAHLHVPAIDDTPNLPTSLSEKAVNGLLRDSLGFEGLVFTDGLNMQGIAKFHSPAAIAVQAIKSGNDILLAPSDIPGNIRAIVAAVAKGEISQATLDAKAKKVLMHKYWAGLHQYEPVALQGLTKDLNSSGALTLKSTLYEQATTLLKNPGQFLPIAQLDSMTFASVSFGNSANNPFQKQLGEYAPFEHHTYRSHNVTGSELNKLYGTLKQKDVVVIGLHDIGRRASSRYNLPSLLTDFIAKLSQTKAKVIVVGFGNPYAFRYLEAAEYLFCAYENDPLMQKAVPQVIFGAISSHASLPITASEQLPQGKGERVFSLGRLGEGFPEQVGMESEVLARIDSIVYAALGMEAMPGCQVLVARYGRVIFNKSYGHHTYSRKTPVSDTSIYDVASLTKVLATLQAVMLLEQQGKISIDQTIGHYLPDLKGSNKERMVIRDILLHQAGLRSFEPFWNNVMIDGEYNPVFLSRTPNERFTVQITPDLYAVEGIADSVWKWTVETPLLRYAYRKRYRYSDLGFIILKELVEKVSGMPLNRFVDENFYHPMGLRQLTYNPLERFDKGQIVPTEMDIYLRKTLVHGYVHDPAAALQNGVGGHAGIFANARSVAAIMQMNLQEGYYGGKWLLAPETIHQFNSRYSTVNRRGLGWDKPPIRNVSTAASDLSSESTFGHTGFTGTCAWADPENQMVYVFLSNRVHPFVGNQKLIRQNIRTEVMDVIYQSIAMYERKQGLSSHQAQADQ